MKPSILSAGLMCRCPECGQAPLFDGLLKVRATCAACGAELALQETGDGPAVFVILAAGALLVPVMLVLMLALKLPVWLTLAIMLPLTVITCIGLLRPFKAVLFAAHWRGAGRSGGGADG